MLFLKIKFKEFISFDICYHDLNGTINLINPSFHPTKIIDGSKLFVSIELCNMRMELVGA